MKCVICTPTLERPHPAYLASLEAAVPLLDAAGIEHSTVFEVGTVYISAARATMLRKALDAKPDVIVFLDHDVGFRPDDLVTLIEAQGDVVAGTYRFKKPEVEYMGGILSDAAGRPIVRDDGCVRAEWVPAGFLKITKECVERFMQAYPELAYGPRYHPSIDLFNHGAMDRVWTGEDIAFCKRWRECGGEIWIVPDMNIDHHSGDQVFAGNFHDYLLRQPGGSKSDNPQPPNQVAARNQYHHPAPKRVIYGPDERVHGVQVAEPQ